MQGSDETGDRTELTLDPATARVLTGLRLAVVAHDQDRAHRLATSLRGWDVTVEVLRATSDASLGAARQIDPEVVLLDPTDLGGAGLSMTRRLEADERLRWASVLRCELGKFWPDDDDRPDLRKLASLLSPLVHAERTLRTRIESEPSVIVELDRLGPSRALRLLASSAHAWAITAQSADARAELLVRDGEVVTATYDDVHVSAPPVRSDLAVRRFLAMRTGVLELTRMENPNIAGIDDVTTHQLAPPPELLVAARDDDTSAMRSIAVDGGFGNDETLVDSEPPGAKVARVVPRPAEDDVTTTPAAPALPSDDAVPPELDEVPTRPRHPSPPSETPVAAPIETPVAAPIEAPVAAPSNGHRAQPRLDDRTERVAAARSSSERRGIARFIALAAVVAGLGAIAIVVVVVLASSSGDDAESALGSVEEAPAALAPPSQGAPQAVAASPADPSPTAAPESPAPDETVTEPPSEQRPAETPSPTPDARADQLIEEADALALPREAARARTLYEEALALDPMSPDAFAGVARTYLAQNRPDEALAPAERASGLAPNQTGLKILLGDVHFARGNVDAARTLWLEVNATRSTARLRQRLERIGALPSPEGEAEAEDEAAATPTAPVVEE